MSFSVWAHVREKQRVCLLLINMCVYGDCTLLVHMMHHSRMYNRHGITRAQVNQHMYAYTQQKFFQDTAAAIIDACRASTRGTKQLLHEMRHRRARDT
jgi:hypothetical protein